MKIVTIDKTTYRTSDQLAETLMDTAREAMAGRIAIYALIRGDFIELTKDTFTNTAGLDKAVRAYRRRGFAVRTIRGSPE